MLWHKKWSSFANQPCSLHGQTAPTITGTQMEIFINTTHNFLKDLVFLTLGKTDDVPKNMDRKFLSWPWGCILRPFLNV